MGRKSDRAFEVIVIGGGFAGLTAAVWLRRYRREILVLSGGPPRNHLAREMHGFPGYDGRDPKDLLGDLRREADSYDTDIRDGWVRIVRKTADGFEVRTAGKTYLAKRLLLATGTTDVKPEIPGFDQYDGVSAWHCPACDGYEYRDKRIVIISWGAHTAAYTREFLGYSNDITVVTHGHACESEEEDLRMLQDRGVRFFDRAVIGLEGKGGQIASLRLDDGRDIPCDGLFYSLAHEPRLELMRQLACDCSDVCVINDHKQLTSVPGVYVAGDVSPLEQLVVVACAMGAVAAHNIHEDLLKEDFGARRAA